MSDWFERAIHEVGHGSIRRTATLTGLDQRALYAAVNAERMLPLRLVRALAEGLGRDAEEITVLWAQAKQERDRAAEAELRQAHADTATWADIPLPSPALRDLLEAQSGILDCLPYALLGLVEPPLSAIYVRQSVRPGPGARRGEPAEDLTEAAGPGEGHGPGHGEPAPGDRAGAVPRPAREAVDPAAAAAAALALPDALARHDHLLITGEAGAGKSTLAGHLVRSLCGVWLRRSSIREAPVAEPVVPLRLSASLLAAESGSWSERLCRAAMNTLGGGLVAAPPVSLFAGRAQGARWLIFVDGLDEIADWRQRAELIRTLARHAHRDSDYRLVVTSRPLPPTELAPLREAVAGEFEIQPFGEPELKSYAHKWFDQQRARIRNPAAAADRFLGELVEEGELKELVRNPLLATIALVNATLEPSLPPAAGRLALYEGFLERLRDRATYGAQAAFPDWLADSADELVRALARLRTEGEEDLAAAARDWVRGRPAAGPLPPRWEGRLPAALVGTGLLVAVGDQLRFLHQSFAEYLAAVAYAEEIPAEGPGLEAWVRRACRGAEQSLALFVLCRWAARPGCAPDRLLEQVFAHPGPERTLLAGTLLAEGVNAGPEQAGRVIRRLADLCRGDDTGDSAKAADALSALGGRHGTAAVLERLVAAPGLSAGHRFRALSALSRLVPPEAATALLGPLLEQLHGYLPKAGQLAVRLGEAARQAVRARLASFLAEPGADAWEWTLAAETHRALEAAEEVERCARRVLADPLAVSGLLRRAADAWLAADPAAAGAVAELALARPAADQAGRLALARALEEAEAAPEAATVAATLVESRSRTTAAQVQAAEIWLRAGGEQAAESASRLLAWGEEQGWEMWRLAWLLRFMAEAGVEREAAEWVGRQLGGEEEIPIGAVDLARLWPACHGPGGMAELQARVGDPRRLNPFERAEWAQLLLDAGLPEEAFRVAELALRSPVTRQAHFAQAARVLLKADRRRAVAELAARSAEQAAWGEWGSGVLDALDEDPAVELDELRLRIAEGILASAEAKGDQVETALGALAEYGGRQRLPEVVGQICRHPALSVAQRRSAAQNLAAYGEEESALEIWRFLLSVRGRESESSGIVLLEDVAQATSFEVAEELVREQLTAEPAPGPFRRRRLERLLAWLGTSPVRG
ncbi:hypothetical protein D7294_00385 [Streptomyces hoynatensis]|uniref:NACHT domain-containing protein n=2 Tax=Streptomyces hoynatensis TaxID=1141874 RepID=A0A3A9ZDW2_9ACTN|nr:hypothetical protein D7294_00385 [Streptomyces hoynatensis]